MRLLSVCVCVVPGSPAGQQTGDGRHAKPVRYSLASRPASSAQTVPSLIETQAIRRPVDGGQERCVSLPAACNLGKPPLGHGRSN